MTESEYLVVGDDGSREAGTAWAWVDAQDWDGWRAEVVTADDDPAKYPTTAELAAPRAWTSPHPRTPAAADRLAGGVRHLVAIGDPRVVLLGFPDAALMVIGQRGHGRLEMLGLGSTADWLLHGPPCPLVIVKNDHPVRTVVVCSDGSAPSFEAARAFALLPWAARARVEVLSVADRHTDPGPAVESMQAVLAEAGVSARPSPRTGRQGDAREVILGAAASTDLVVLGVRGVGVGMLRHLFGGSVATYLAHRAPCSVMVADGVPGSSDAG